MKQPTPPPPLPWHHFVYDVNYVVNGQVNQVGYEVRNPDSTDDHQISMMPMARVSLCVMPFGVLLFANPSFRV